MGWSKKESVYDRRIRELEEEAERVRKNMQQLMRNIPRDLPADGSTSTSSLAAGMRPAGFTPRNPAHKPAGSVEEQSDDVPSEESLSEWRSSFPDTAGRGRAATPSQSPRLASYLASGSFGKSRSLSRDRRIERNKAIMMLIFAIISIYSVISWIK